MRLRGAKLAIVLAMALVAMQGIGWAQAPDEMPPLSLTGRLLFGYADFSQSTYSQGGPAATLESDLAGYWRSPRIFQFDFRPTISFGSVVPGTEMGNALTGFSAQGTFLQGSSFPLSVTYSRNGSSFEESGIGTGTNGILSGVEVGTTNSVLDIDWSLRFNRLPTFRFDYRDMGYSSDLPLDLGGGDSRNSHAFSANMNYQIAGWQTAAWYRLTQSSVLFPDLLTGGGALQRDDSRNSDLGFTVSRLLPWNSTIGVSGDQSDSKFDFAGLETSTTVRNANVTLTSRPIQRLNVMAQAQYTSNWEGAQEQAALLGAGVGGTGGTGTTTGGPAATPLPILFLALPYDVYSVGGGAAFQIGHGFTANASLGESQSSNIVQSSNRWSAGLTYQRKWNSGWMAAAYTRSSSSNSSQFATSVVNPGPLTTFTEDIGTNTGSVNLIQDLPRRFKLAAWAQFSDGTITDNGIPYPDHSYNGQVSVTRAVGEWTLNGSFTVNKNDLARALLQTDNTGRALSFGAAYRGLSVTAGYLYGSGLALQFGNNLVFVNNPVPIVPVLGVPTLSSTSGETLNATYHSRRNRLMLIGNYGHFNYTTLGISATAYTVASLRASYGLRRLRLLAGYSRQSQVFGVGPAGLFETRLIYFQIERRFKIF